MIRIKSFGSMFFCGTTMLGYFRRWKVENVQLNYTSQRLGGEYLHKFNLWSVGSNLE